MKDKGVFPPNPGAEFVVHRFSIGRSTLYRANGLVQFSDVQHSDGTFDRHDVPHGAQVVQLDIETVLSFRGENRDRFLVVDPERWQVEELEGEDHESPEYRARIERYLDESWEMSEGVRLQPDGDLTRVLVAYRPKPAVTK